MIAALFVQKNGVYYGLPDVDPWDTERDARKYAGPWPCVAHPPCERWGKYWHGGPTSLKFPRTRKIKGDDGGCFGAALSAVRRWGGVIEHPQASAAWRAFDLNTPPWGGGWVSADFFGGWTCCVEQGHYGHRARKATWLYAFGVARLPSLTWGPSESRARLDEGFHSATERMLARAMRREVRELLSPYRVARLSKAERSATPIAFRDVLLSLARGARNTQPDAVASGETDGAT